ncbi:chemotaxis protein [Ornithinibacillus gellani]|uniref:chemotaxis protein n=1 Tax=Ornithinibacillus gellani TaxID=2293253 RepID=UPI000F47045B|nr:chemotaxis protein [Ornithinibacillus gellani]TQS74917.1 chemotaxis protein [Ornithinibacillus gellani]
MAQKIAILVLHGAGTPKEDFADDLIDRIAKRVARKLKLPAEEVLVFQPVFWSAIFSKEQTELFRRIEDGNALNFHRLRRFVVEFLADAVAYQPTIQGDQNYHQVHGLVAKSVNLLKEKAGEHAPLCVISHSLGSVVASNYFYDLQYNHEQLGRKTMEQKAETPIETCQTLALFYTLGSPLALWSLRYLDFGSPITVPAPAARHFYPKLTGEWLNFFDKDDVLAYPLKNVNKAYDDAVTEDVEVNAGGMLTHWNPLSHREYDRTRRVIDRIVDGLVRTWREIN